jgi:hypothetical protein
MRRLPPIAAIAMLVLAGCTSSDDEETPAACLAPASAYLDALDAAPGAVTLDGTTPISDCFPPGQDAADLAQVGQAVIETADQLNAAARRDPAGAQTVALGYLVGAVQEGTSATGGIHADLVRRLDAAARFVPQGERLPVSFERAFNEGYAAGQRSG